MLVFFSRRRRHTRFDCDWSSDVCSSDLVALWWFQAVAKADPRYRDAKAQADRLGGGPGPQPADEAPRAAAGANGAAERKGGGGGKGVDLGGRRIIKKKQNNGGVPRPAHP